MATEKKKGESNNWNLIPWVFEKAVDSLEGFARAFFSAAENTAEDLFRKGLEKLVSFFLVAVGTLFLAVGVAAFLSDYFHVAGVGPLIVGGAFLLMGLFFMLSRRA